MDGELLGRAILELTTDDRPLELGLASAERRVAISTGAMQAMLDKQSRQAGTSLGSVGQTIDRQLVPPIGRLSAASEQMGTRVEDSLQGVRSDAQATRRDLDGVHSALIEISRTMPPASQLAALGGGDAQRTLATGPDATASRNVIFTPAASSTVTLDSAQYAGLISAITQSGVMAPVALGGGGGGGGGAPPVALGGGQDGRGPLGRLGWGGGIIGMAGIGSALSFAGLGFEHLITTMLGILGSAAGAGIGAGALGLGTLGTMAVGTGSDAAVMKSTITDTRTLYKAYQNLTQAQAIYGKGSRQAAIAQAQLNLQLQQLGPASGAELALAKSVDQLNTLWDKQTAAARLNAVAILQQAAALGTVFVPQVAAAAKLNLGIINDSIKPLFDWLKGPQGLQIWNDLEHKFSTDLPIAVHAFDQGVELLLRITDLASQHTGGFVTSLDHLLTRLNSMDNAQLGAVVTRYVNQFHLWGTFVKLLGEDLVLLFHQDVGTGSAIISTLDGMLLKLHAYETSARGSAQLQNIFMVHKTEVLELIHVLLSLGSTFGSVYMAIAPVAVTAMNDVVLPIFKAIGDAIAFIAGHSHLAAVGLGLMLISFKAFGIGTTVGALKSFFAWFTGAELTNAAAADADAAAQGRLSGATLLGAGAGTARAGVAVRAGQTVETAGFSAASVLAGRGAAGAGVSVANLGATLGAVVTGAIRVAIPTLAGFLAERLAVSLLHISDITASKTSVRLGPGGTAPSGFKVTGGGFQSNLPGVLGRGEQAVVNSVLNLAGFSTGGTLEITGKIAAATTAQLLALVAALEKADGVKVNGVSEAKNQVRALAEAALAARNKWNDAWDIAHNRLQLFYLDASRKLPALYDDFNTNMRLIASTMGINSNAGRQMVAENVQKMVAAVRQGMLDGKVSVAQGMAAINSVTHTGLTDGAITWDQQWRDRFSTVTALYSHHKLDTAAYLSQLRQIQATGDSHIRSDTQASYRKTFADLQHQRDQGLISQGIFNAKVHGLSKSSNQQEAQDMKLFAGKVVAGMIAAGTASAAGTTAILNPLNRALKALGASPISMIGLGASTAASVVTGALSGITGGFAAGGLVQFGRPGEAGRDTIPLNVGGQDIVVAPGEQMAVFSRHHIPEVNARFADFGGLGGYFAKRKRPNYMASGGYVYPFGSGASLGRTDQGVDASGSGPVGAIGPGKVTYSNARDGWYPPAPAFMVYQLSAGPDAGRYVYLAEHIANLARAGTKLSAGQALATMTGGIETGWAAGPQGHQIVEPMGSSHLTAAGQDFAAFLHGLAHGVISGGGALGALGAGPAAWKNIKAPGVTGRGALAQIVRAALKKETAAANAYGASKTGISAGAFAGQGGSNSANMALGRRMMLAAGFGVDQWPALQALWTQESGWDANSVNPHSGAYGIPQSLGHGHPYNLGDAPSQIAWGLSYIRQRYGTPSSAEAHERAYNWYSRGGLVGYAPGGILAHVSKARPKVRTPKHHKAAKPRRLGKFKSLPGFDQTLLDQIASSEQHVSDLGAWQSYLDSLHSSQGIGSGQVTGLVTLADGSQVVNWNGMVDPSTGQFAPGITARLAAIGDPGSNPNATATRDKMTELGVDEQLLDAFISEQGLAGRAGGKFAGWLTGMKRDLHKRLRKQRNLQALIAYQQKLLERLGPERAERDAQITRRFEIARHRIQSASATGTFDASQLTAAQLSGLSSERRDALAKVPVSPPGSFLGDTSTWFQARSFERARIGDEFAARELALRSAASQHRFAGSQSRSNALFGLGLEEQADKDAVRKAFDKKRISLDDKLRAERLEKTRADKYVTADHSALSAGTGDPSGKLAPATWGGSFYGTLNDALNPMGTLALNRLQKENIDIPGLISEIAQLKGTSVPAAAPGSDSGAGGAGSTGPDSSALIAALEQKVAEAGAALAVSQAQYKVLGSLPPFGGSFASGGIVPGPDGMPRTIIAHGGEAITPADAPATDVRVSISAKDAGWLKDLIDVRIDQKNRRAVGGAARGLPSRGGGGF